MHKAVIFDKDGTLLDFDATWNEAVGAAFDQISDQRQSYLVTTSIVDVFCLSRPSLVKLATSSTN